MKFNIVGVTGLLLVLLQSNVNAISFGVFDPRSLAMGGTGVASGNAGNATYYNPALLAIYKVRKEKGKNSRFVFPTLTVRVPKVVIDYDKNTVQSLDQGLRDSISAFNNAGQVNAIEAQAVIDASSALQDNLTSFSDGPLDVEINAGIVISIAHLLHGGAMYINTRAVAGSDISGTAADKKLLSDYTDAMRYVASNRTEGNAHPELYDANLNLIDQSDALSSSATGRGGIMNEIGISMSAQFRLFNSTFAIGMTPKMNRVATYDITAKAVDNSADAIRDKTSDWKTNLDLGLLKEFDKQLWSGNIRAGLILKNIISREFQTSLGNSIKFEPQLRAGTSYHRRGTVYAVDIDILANNSIGSGNKSQMLAIGGEWKYAITKLRAGISYNIKARGDYRTPLLAAGALIDFGPMIDFSYAISNVEQSAGIQIAFKF
ncbi:MAG: conjugal transfer protein TraF [Thiohalomonadales bacterium]